MFDGVILGDACLIVMSSTRRLQAITGNAGFFAVDINVIVDFSPYRGSTVVAAASSATLTVVSCAVATETAPTYWNRYRHYFVFDIHTVLLWTLPDNCLS